MISVIIFDNHEPKVIELTYENLYREIKNIEGSQLLVSDDWFKALNQVKNDYVCFVESDCLVNSGYFSSMMGLITKNTHLRKLGIFGTAVGVNNFANRFYGYRLDEKFEPIGKTDSGKVIEAKIRYIEPVRDKKSTAPYPVQMAYVPGAILRVSMVKDAIKRLDFPFAPQTNLTRFSAMLSLSFWEHGARVHINPNATYVTTEDYVNDRDVTTEPNQEVMMSFKKEVI